ncbi:MAG: hypothetical protein QOI38_2873 [Sphingomonadales bacterium]|jgi:hypothetical protein|nr:hypothetical protein [Sphingomonadales bacterium]
MHILNPEDPARIPTLDRFDSEFSAAGRPPVAIFDFDGVLCAPREDLAYKLPEQPGERKELCQAARHYGIVPDLYDTPYLRHLTLQAILADRQTLPEPGPLLGLARELSLAGRPFFLLTARSGRAAIDRALSFLDAHELRPQEIFFVGRVPKGRQLALVRRTILAPTTLAYFEDSLRHSRNSKLQEVEGLETFHIDWAEPERFAPADLMAEALAWFMSMRRDRRAA